VDNLGRCWHCGFGDSWNLRVRISSALRRCSYSEYFSERTDNQTFVRSVSVCLVNVRYRQALKVTTRVYPRNCRMSKIEPHQSGSLFIFKFTCVMDSGGRSTLRSEVGDGSHRLDSVVIVSLTLHYSSSRPISVQWNG
jgi:hypothetical protein